jgi:CRISPR-associated protein Cas2
MLLVTYDFSNDKQRTKFAKFLQKHGRRLQYSVFEIRNSRRVLNIILQEIELKFKKHFSWSDSILIFPISEVDESKTIRYGWATHEDEEVIIFK